MINFRDHSKAAASAVIVVSLLVLAMTLAFLLFWPKPSAKGIDAKRRKQEFAARLATDAATDNLKLAQAKITQGTWNLADAQVGPAALAKVSAIARNRGVKLIAFRPQRRNDDGPVPQLPFLLSVEGKFPAIVALLRDLEEPETRLATSLVQISSSDASTDLATASIGLVALMPATEEGPRG